MDTSASDATLVARAQTDDAQSFDGLVQQHGSALLYAAYRLAGDWDEARDIVQDALVYAFYSLDRLRDPGRFLPWVRTIVARTYQRQRGLQARRQELLNYHMEVGGGDPSIAAAATPLPDQALYDGELAVLVHRALGSLAERNRRIVELYYLQDKPIKEIAATLQLSADTVKNRLRSAREHLKEEMATMTATQPTANLRAQRVARFRIWGNFPGDPSNPCGLNENLLYQRVLAACRKQPLAPAVIAERVGADEAYILDALASLLDREIVAEAEAGKFVANCFFPTAADDRERLRRSAPYAAPVLRTLKAHLAAIKEAVDSCSFAARGFGWERMRWIALYEWLPQPPAPGRPPALSRQEVLESIGPLRPDGGHWYVLGRDLDSPLAAEDGGRSFSNYGDLGRHHRIEWPGGGRQMKVDEFALAASLARGPRSWRQLADDAPVERVAEVLAGCVESGYIFRCGEQYQLNMPVVWPEDEERIAAAILPVAQCLDEARAACQAAAISWARELGFDWLLDNEPGAVKAGMAGLPGLNRQLKAEGLVGPPPAGATPCWGMWVKMFEAGA